LQDKAYYLPRIITTFTIPKSFNSTIRNTSRKRLN